MPTADQHATPEAGPADPEARRRGSSSVRRQLLIALGLVAVMVAAPAIYALARLDQIGAIARDLRGQYAQSSVVLGEAQAALADLDRHLRGYVATGDPALRGRAVRAWTQADMALGELAGSGYEGARAVRTTLGELSGAVDVVLGHMDRGELQEASLAFETVKPLLAESRRQIWPLARAIDERAARTVSRAEETSVATATTLLLALLGTLLLAVLIALWTTRKVSGPLHDLKEAVTGLARGRFRAPVDLPYDRSDEIGALAREFAAMTDRLAELERLRADFVAAASHDLKNPINVIGGYAQMLGDAVYGPMSREQAEIAGRIHEQAAMLEQQVEQLTDLSRMEAGGFRVEPGAVGVAEIVGRVERSFRALADQRGIRFVVDEGSGAPDRVVVDADRIQHEVLGNLLGNAFKFTDTGGEVLLRVGAAEDGAFEIVVRDTGRGIPAAALPYIFERYYQVGDRDRRGGGLGLAIAHQVVEAHGGTIEVESRQGRGTTFTITLPPEGRPTDGADEAGPVAAVRPVGGAPEGAAGQSWIAAAWLRLLRPAVRIGR